MTAEVSTEQPAQGALEKDKCRGNVSIPQGRSFLEFSLIEQAVQHIKRLSQIVSGLCNASYLTHDRIINSFEFRRSRGQNSVSVCVSCVWFGQSPTPQLPDPKPLRPTGSGSCLTALPRVQPCDELRDQRGTSPGRKRLSVALYRSFHRSRCNRRLPHERRLATHQPCRHENRHHHGYRRGVR